MDLEMLAMFGYEIKKYKNVDVSASGQFVCQQLSISFMKDIYEVYMHTHIHMLLYKQE